MIRIKYILLLLFLFVIFSCNSRKEVPKSNFEQSYTEMRNKLQNPNSPFWQYEGEIELEKEGHIYTFHYKYDGADHQIRISGELYPDFIPLFADGRLHPSFVGGGCIQVSMTFINEFRQIHQSKDGKVRSYRIWSRCEHVMNPCEYIIKLENKEATESTSTKEFVEKAVLTSVSPCSVII